MRTVAIADDQARVRQGIRDMLENEPDLTIIGEAGSGPETLNLVNDLQPDILILDLALGDVDGMDIASRLQNSPAETDIVIYSMYGYSSYLDKARRLGVKGYVLKRSSPEELVKAIRTVLDGGLYYYAP